MISTLAEYLNEWIPAAGPDNLGADHPNATLSLDEPGVCEQVLRSIQGGSGCLRFVGRDVLWGV